jgi:hypothetical protein
VRVGMVLPLEVGCTSEMRDFLGVKSRVSRWQRDSFQCWMLMVLAFDVGCASEIRNFCRPGKLCLSLAKGWFSLLSPGGISI